MIETLVLFLEKLDLLHLLSNTEQPCCSHSANVLYSDESSVTCKLCDLGQGFYLPMFLHS